MFTTEKIAAFLQGVKFTGDSDKKNLELTIYITPISYELAAEVSEGIADRLFREGSDGRWNPALEMPSARFEGPKIPVQTVTVYPVADGAMPEKELEKSRTALINVNIDSFSSLRLIAEKPDLTLAFKAHVDMDKVSVELAMRYFKTKVYLTFAAMQAELPMGHPDTVESKLKSVIGELLTALTVVPTLDAKSARGYAIAKTGDLIDLLAQLRADLLRAK
jgi:hypothetical protein